MILLATWGYWGRSFYCNTFKISILDMRYSKGSTKEQFELRDWVGDFLNLFYFIEYIGVSLVNRII